jgi:uncharacterized membrane protein
MPVHPLVVHFPLALWLTSALFDLLAWRRDDPLFPRAAFWLVGLGLVGALASIGSGWYDLLQAERQGVGPGLLLRHRTHSLLAYAATATYLASFLWRWRRPSRRRGGFLPLVLLGAVLVAVAGFLGGELRTVM